MSIARAALLATAGAPALLSFPLIAQTTIDNDRTGPLRTSQTGDLTLGEDGSVTVTTGAAIIVDSNNSVSSEGEIEAGEDSGATGIRVLPGTSGTIFNDGSIVVREDFVPQDANEDGIADGPIARASQRYGILVAGGGTFTGTIRNEGAIAVDGLNSGGIVIASDLVGDLVHTGTISVIGDNSVGVRTGDVTGDVQLRGAIGVIGKGTSAYVSEGVIDGKLVIQGTLTQSTVFSDDDGNSLSLSRNDLRAGAAAVWIKDDVTGGITIATAPDTEDANDDDEDNDGFDDDEEGTGSITGYGAAPALLIGAADPIAIGAGSEGYALQVDGAVSANAARTTINATAVSIGGSGENVTLEGGILLTGQISATTVNATAIGVLIGENAVVPTLELRDGGTITTGISSTGDGASIGVRDLSGTLTTIRSNGFITANGSFEDEVYAIDLSANTSGVSIIQYTADDEDDDEEELINTSIIGDIRTGSGNDLLDVSDGQIRGDSFLAGGNDRVQISGDAIYRGDIDFGSGTGTLAISDTAQVIGTLDFNNTASSVTITGEGSFRGEIEGGSGLAVNVTSGSFGARDTDVLSFSSLTVGSEGSLVVFIDEETGQSSLIDVGTASFASGATIGFDVDTLDVPTGTFTVLTADTLTGAPVFADEGGDLPFIFSGEVVTDTAAGEITLTIRRRTAIELGLDPALDVALPAILEAATAAPTIEGSLLAADSGAVLRRQLIALTPEYSGGNFDLVTRASRTAANTLSDQATMFEVSGTRAFLHAYTLSGERDSLSASGYELSGTGFTGGYELPLGPGRFGLSGNLFWGSNSRSDANAAVDASLYEIALHWRVQTGPLLAFVRGSAGWVSFSSERRFEGYSDGIEDADEDGERDAPDVTNSTTGDFNGLLFSGVAGLSYKGEFGRRLSVTPEASVEYFRLSEDGYEESGGGDSMNLTLASRTSDAVNLNALVTVSYTLSRPRNDSLPFAVSIAGGRRTNLAGSLGATVAQFEDTDSFTLAGRSIEDAWIGRVGIAGGGYDFKWFLTGTGERETDQTSYTVQAGLEVAF